MSITAALSRHAARTPDRDALVFEEQRISWRHLDREINRLAGFIAATTPAGGSVALHLPTSPALALLFLAVARAGREAQVLDPDWPAEMTRSILSRLSSDLLVSFDGRFAGSNPLSWRILCCRSCRYASPRCLDRLGRRTSRTGNADPLVVSLCSGAWAQCRRPRHSLPAI